MALDAHAELGGGVPSRRSEDDELVRAPAAGRSQEAPRPLSSAQIRELAAEARRNLPVRRAETHEGSLPGSLEAQRKIREAMEQGEQRRREEAARQARQKIWSQEGKDTHGKS